VVAASDRTIIRFEITGGQVHDATQVIPLLTKIKKEPENKYVIMDRAYEAERIRNKVLEFGCIPIVPPKKNRREKWDYDKELYKRRNTVERFFLRLKRFRRIFTRYDKLDLMFCNFIYFVLIIDILV